MQGYSDKIVHMSIYLVTFIIGLIFGCFFTKPDRVRELPLPTSDKPF